MKNPISLKPIREHFNSERARQYTLVAEIVMLIAVSSLAGAGVAASPRWHRRPIKVNSSLFLSAVRAPAESTQGNIATDSIVAVQEERISQLNAELTAGLQESRDDRRLLHDEIAKTAGTDNDHFNALSDRLNVDEARVSTVLWVVGFVFTVVQGVLLFLQLNARKRHAAETEDAVSVR